MWTLSGSARISRFDLGLVVQNHVQQGIMDFQARSHAPRYQSASNRCFGDNLQRIGLRSRPHMALTDGVGSQQTLPLSDVERPCGCRLFSD